jgi:hypothetical protein
MKTVKIFILAVVCVSFMASCNAKKDSGKSEFLYRVGFVNIADRDPVCYPSMLKFIDRINSEEILKKVGVEKIEVLTADSDLNIERQATNVETMLTKDLR